MNIKRLYLTSDDVRRGTDDKLCHAISKLHSDREIDRVDT